MHKYFDKDLKLIDIKAPKISLLLYCERNKADKMQEVQLNIKPSDYSEGFTLT